MTKSFRLAFSIQEEEAFPSTKSGKNTISCVKERKKTREKTMDFLPELAQCEEGNWEGSFYFKQGRAKIRAAIDQRMLEMQP